LTASTTLVDKLFHIIVPQIKEASWNALIRIEGSIYNIYSLLGGIYFVYTTSISHYCIPEQWMAVLYAIYTPSLPFEVRCESGMYIYICVCVCVLDKGLLWVLYGQYSTQTLVSRRNIALGFASCYICLSTNLWVLSAILAV